MSTRSERVLVLLTCFRNSMQRPIVPDLLSTIKKEKPLPETAPFHSIGVMAMRWGLRLASRPSVHPYIHAEADTSPPSTMPVS